MLDDALVCEEFNYPNSAVERSLRNISEEFGRHFSRRISVGPQQSEFCVIKSDQVSLIVHFFIDAKQMVFDSLVFFPRREKDVIFA